jgi:hypothetical protein
MSHCVESMLVVLPGAKVHMLKWLPLSCQLGPILPGWLARLRLKIGLLGSLVPCPGYF